MYRAITRESIVRGLSGTITYKPKNITVTLDQPGQGRVTRALTLLIAEINTRPPALPGDGLPITYTFRQSQRLRCHDPRLPEVCDRPARFSRLVR